MSTATLPRLFDPEVDVLDAPPTRRLDDSSLVGMPGGLAPGQAEAVVLEYLQYFIGWD